MTWTAVPVKCKREIVLDLCDAIDIYNYNLAFSAGDGSSTTPNASEVKTIDLVNDYKPSISTSTSISAPCAVQESVIHGEFLPGLALSAGGLP
eukprot:11570726-Ditylum_brightwellii.AAC.1